MCVHLMPSYSHPIPHHIFSGACTEWEMVNDNGFIFKRRKRHRDADVVPLAMKDGQPEEDAKRVAKVTLNLAKKKQMLLSTKARSELVL